MIMAMAKITAIIIMIIMVSIIVIIVMIVTINYTGHSCYHYYDDGNLYHYCFCRRLSCINCWMSSVDLSGSRLRLEMLYFAGPRALFQLVSYACKGARLSGR